MRYNSTVSFVNDKIYFIIIDRFHDGSERKTIQSRLREKGFGNADELFNFYGGNFKGIKNKLQYIKNMGFTAIWLSPFFENTQNEYHGYAIKDFTTVDPHFGAEQDLTELVTEAHNLNIKIYIDVIINHSGNVWQYIGNHNYKYNKGLQYPFGKWTEENYPKPAVLRNIDLYERRGMIENWDQYPELALGDFFELKKFKLDETDFGLEAQHHLLNIYCDWIKKYDFDGIRIDTARHISPLAIVRFTHKIKEFAKNLGKKEFPVFIEAPFLSDHELVPYFSIQTDSEGISYSPPDGFLDFYLHFDIPKYFAGHWPSGKINQRFQTLQTVRQLADSPMYQVTFLDNHDQVAENHKERIANKLNNKKLMEAWAFLIDTNTIPCLYYGTEQGLTGAGSHDRFLREAMFDMHSDAEIFNEKHPIYQKLKKINRSHHNKVTKKPRK
jgi:glycosidase